MKLNLIIESTDFEKLQELANELRYDKEYGFLAKAVDKLGRTVKELKPRLRRTR